MKRLRASSQSSILSVLYVIRSPHPREAGQRVKAWERMVFHMAKGEQCDWVLSMVVVV